MIDTIRNQRILVLIAHPDDEALYCACAVRQLANQGNRVWIQPVTAIADCNPMDDPAEEANRQQARQSAFEESCRLLGAWPLPNMDYENARDKDAQNQLHEDLWRELSFAPYDLVISHGESGESGHPQHKTVSEAVETCRDFNPVPLLTFSPDGPISVPIDHNFKQRVLDCYRYGCTRTPEWHPTPELNPELAPWLTDFERFDLWPAQRD